MSNNKAFVIMRHTFVHGGQPYAVCVDEDSARSLKRDLDATIEDILEEYEIKEVEIVL